MYGLLWSALGRIGHGRITYAHWDDGGTEKVFKAGIFISQFYLQHDINQDAKWRDFVANRLKT